MALAITEHEKWLAEQRRLASQFGGVGNISHTESAGRVSDIIAQKVALAEAIAERLQGRHGSNQYRQKGGGNISTSSDDAGKTRDIAAAKAGLGSGKTLEAAQRVVERGIPELVAAIAERLQGRVGNPALRANCGNISTIERGDTTPQPPTPTPTQPLTMQIF